MAVARPQTVATKSVERQRLVLAVDLGTSGCKCALVGLDGTVLAWAFRPVTLHVDGVSAEQDPQEWWSAFMAAGEELFAADPRMREQVVAVCSIDAEKLPELLHSTDVLGPLLPGVADALGLDRRTHVVAGAIDNSAVAIGACAVRDFDTHLYLGTSSWLGAHVPFKKTDIRHKIASVPCAISDRYLAFAMQSAAGANLSFLRDRILFHRDELWSNEERPDVYRLLDQIAERVPPGTRGLLYTPWLFGERTPVDDTFLRAGLLNLSLEHSREDVIRAFLEGVALNTRWMFEPFSDFLARQPQNITAVGGGAQSDVWCQILADVTGCAIRQPEDAIQANAIGAGFIGGVGIGALNFADLPTPLQPRVLRRRV